MTMENGGLEEYCTDLVYQTCAATLWIGESLELVTLDGEVRAGMICPMPSRVLWSSNEADQGHAYAVFRDMMIRHVESFRVRIITRPKRWNPEGTFLTLNICDGWTDSTGPMARPP